MVGMVGVVQEDEEEHLKDLQRMLLDDANPNKEGEGGEPKKKTVKRLQLRRVTTRTRADGSRQVCLRSYHNRHNRYYH
jgi:hypothetical protein